MKTLVEYAAIIVSCLTLAICRSSPLMAEEPDADADTADEKSSCAVITFDHGADAHPGQAGLLSARFGLLLADTGNYEVMSRYKMNRILVRQGFDPMSYPSLPAAAVAAGRALKTDYVVYGAVTRKENLHILTTSLIDVKSGKVVNTVTRNYTEDPAEFMRIAPQANLNDLLKISDIPQKPKPMPEKIADDIPVKPKPAPERVADDIPGKPDPMPEKIAPKPIPVPPVLPLEPTPERPSPKMNLPEPIESPHWDVAPKSEFPKGAEETKPAAEPRKLKDAPPKKAQRQEFVMRPKEVESLTTGRFAVGTRTTTFKLKTMAKSSFLGSIDLLDAEQNRAPYKLFATWMFSPWFGVEATWDSLEAATVTSYDGHTDGKVALSGPILTVLARRATPPILRDGRRALVPYAGLGIAMMNADFKHEGWWHNGFSADDWRDAERAYDEWVAAGSTEWPNGGYQRTMKLDNATGFVITGGLMTALNWKWSVDLYVRYMNIDINDEFTLSYYGDVTRTETVTLPMSNYAVGLGIRYLF